MVVLNVNRPLTASGFVWVCVCGFCTDQVPRSSPVTSRETQKKVLVGTLVGFLGLALAVALVSPDGRVLSINGSRQSVTHRVVMSGKRTPDAKSSTS